MIRLLLLVFLCIHLTLGRSTSKGASSAWQTINGNQPLVIAREGFSGLAPESSELALQAAIVNSLPNVAIYCDLQLSKDGVGFCISNIDINNSTAIADAFPKGETTYNVNGQQVQGWFSLDYTSKQLHDSARLKQSVYSRTGLFDGVFSLPTVDDVIGEQPPNFWVNVQYDSFFTQHNLSCSTFVQKALRATTINYISSPEVNFLKTISKIVNQKKTKLVFRFEEADTMEPTTNQTYGTLLKNLAAVKSFASGVLVPKDLIWPLSKEGYLEAATSLVTDAHKEGLEVYAYGFANDNPASYNYSYDPEAEYLQFIDNSQFSVDGILTDFPSTASAAVGCLAHSKNGTRNYEDVLIITHNGASGIYAGGTDLAYDQAVTDGADIIDCSVQMSKDGVAFCLGSTDLLKGTTAMSSFMSRSVVIPEIQQSSGIFSFDLTWSEIQTLKPLLTSDLPDPLPRNPANKNLGNFMTLQEFLQFAKKKAVPGILIDIKNAAYLASKKGLSITDAVASALSNATFNKQSIQKVLIQSDDSSVLVKFKDVPSYTKVLYISEELGDAPKKPVDEIKKFADAVTIPRASIIQTSSVFFTTKNTTVVEEMHAANISVYVGIFRNEYISIALDFFSDPLVEISTNIQGFKVDGIITEYPGTASNFLRSPCSDINSKGYIVPAAQTGYLLSMAPPEAQPPAQAPNPALDVSDVLDPPLPAVSNASQADSTPAPAAAPTNNRSSSNAGHLVCTGLSLVAIAVAALV